MSRNFLLLLLLIITGYLPAKANFIYDTNCTDAYKAILDLRVTDARLLIQKEKQQNPKNGIILLLENYIDYFGLLASENKQDYERLKDNRADRLSALSDNDRGSPFCLYAQAQINLQWSFLKAKFGDYVSSALDAKKANGLLKDNEEKFPGFLPDQFGLALVNVIFGSIPANLKSVTRFLGMSGNAQVGLKKLEEINGELPKTRLSFYNNEVIFFICTVDINVLHNSADYAKLIAYTNEMDNDSLLKTYLQGVVASKTGHNDEAISYLAAAPKSNAYLKLPVLSYLAGCAKLNKMSADAPDDVLVFLREYKGTNDIKDAYLKLAYFYLLQKDEGKYQYFLRQVKTKGYATDEKDQQALFEANDNKPDIDLLKARFYFDGGYYSKALAQLASKNEHDFKLLRDKTEFYYRQGRIYDKTGKFNEAVANYQEAIRLGKTSKYYFAANSALNIGKLFEERKDVKKAAEYYNLALDMPAHQYQTDIDNDAKAGLKRIGE